MSHPVVLVPGFQQFDPTTDVDKEAATAAFRAALRRKSDHVPLRVELGECLLQLDRFDEAREQFTLARDADAACAPAWRGLAQLALKPVGGDLGTAWWIHAAYLVVFSAVCFALATWFWKRDEGRTFG